MISVSQPHNQSPNEFGRRDFFFFCFWKFMQLIEIITTAASTFFPHLFIFLLSPSNQPVEEFKVDTILHNSYIHAATFFLSICFTTSFLVRYSYTSHYQNITGSAYTTYETEERCPQNKYKRSFGPSHQGVQRSTNNYTRESQLIISKLKEYIMHKLGKNFENFFSMLKYYSSLYSFQSVRFELAHGNG